MTYPIPRDAFDDRLAILGTSGSGKTYLVMGAIEHLFHSRARVIAIDPLGVMWGLRLCADGMTPSPYQPVIFGGPHGDLPITEYAGAVIGEAVATSRESCILDLSELGTKAAERRFVLAFLTALYRLTDRQPVHLIIDEADMFAPQTVSDREGEAAKLLGMMETVVRRGRIRGFIPWLISQRPAVLNKNVLSQADGLVAMKLTSSQDRDQLGDWVEGAADKAKWKELRAELPTLQRGEGLIWIPARGVLKRASFPGKATYDSSRTPARGEVRRQTELQPIDIPSLKAKLATVEAETKASDPKILRARVAELERHIAQGQKTAPEDQQLREDAIRSANASGYRAGWLEGHQTGVEIAREELKRAYDGMIEVFKTGQGIIEAKGFENERNAPKLPKNIPSSSSGRTSDFGSDNRRSIRREGTKAAPVNGKGEITGPQAKILCALAWWKALGHDVVTRAQLAAKAKFALTGGHFTNRMSELSRAGLIVYPGADRVALTDEGARAAPDPDVNSSVADSIRQNLTNPQMKIFDVLLRNRHALTREVLAEAANFEATGGHFTNRLSELNRLGILDYPERGTVKLQDWVR